MGKPLGVMAPALYDYDEGLCDWGEGAANNHIQYLWGASIGTTLFMWRNDIL